MFMFKSRDRKVETEINKNFNTNRKIIGILCFNLEENIIHNFKSFIFQTQTYFHSSCIYILSNVNNAEEGIRFFTSTCL